MGLSANNKRCGYDVLSPTPRERLQRERAVPAQELSKDGQGAEGSLSGQTRPAGLQEMRPDREGIRLGADLTEVILFAIDEEGAMRCCHELFGPGVDPTAPRVWPLKALDTLHGHSTDANTDKTVPIEVLFSM